jgi:dTMP kinase
VPDLAVILSADPGSIAARIAARGATHRFNRARDFPARESARYAEVAVVLRGMGVPVLVVETRTAPAGVIAQQIAAYAPAGLGSVAPDLESTRTQGAPPS